jgi:hypothetical protein
MLGWLSGVGTMISRRNHCQRQKCFRFDYPRLFGADRESRPMQKSK